MLGDDAERPDGPDDVHPSDADTAAVPEGDSDAGFGGGQRELPKRVGSYHILDQLGEGGMGVVYLAEQREPVRRRVALKVIKWGMDTKQVIARFESERQALALMSHPNIAKVFDAGSTGSGRPYFVMEYVPGLSITDYCDKHRLDTSERLELFAQVCRGIQHAHQKGIIHRDIKPSNILVSVEAGEPIPKVIDFGVAKATSQQLTELTLHTEQGQMVGTPEYMSPEQAEMTPLDVDTRTDIYSLGVVLYEMLTGTLPFEPTQLRRAAADEMRRIIREDDPPTPSTRLSSLGVAAREVARRRRTDPDSLRRLLRGDLDWIVMKLLEKDRTRRYETTSELVADIYHYRRNEPVVARPPSKLYRAGKFVRRHRTSVAAAATVMVSIVVLGSVATWMGVRAQREAARVQAASILLSAQAAEEPLLGALLLGEIADGPEPLGGIRVAQQVLSGSIPRAVLRGHDGVYVWDAAFSPDGLLLATAAADDLVRIYNTDGSGSPLVLAGHEADVLSVAFSPDGRLIGASSADGSLRVWNADGSGEPLVFGTDGISTSHIAFDPLGRRLLAIDDAGHARLWPVAPGAEATVLGEDDERVFDAAFSPDGLRLALATGSSIELVSADGTGEPVVVAESESFGGLLFSRDGSMLGAYGNREGDLSVSVWMLDGSGEQSTVIDEDGSIWDFAFSPDGSRLATVSESNTILWLIRTDAEVAEPPKTAVISTQIQRAGGDPLDGVRVTVLTLTETFVTQSDDDGQVRLSDLPPGPANVVFRKEGYNTVVREGLGLEPGRVVSFTMTMEETEGEWRPGPPAREGGPRPQGAPYLPSRTQKLDELSTGGQTVEFSPDGTLLVIGTGEPRSLLWNVGRDGLEPVELIGDDQPNYDAFFSPDGALVATLAARGSIRLWDAAGPAEPRNLNPSNARALRDPLFSRDGRFLATAANDDSVYVWDVRAGGEPLVLRGHGGRINQVVFSPEADRLLTVSSDGTARVWPLAGGAPVVIGGYAAAISHGAFSPDGRQVAIVVGDATVRVWNADGTVPPKVLSSFQRAAGVSFSPDGSRVILVEPTGAVAVWRLDGRPDTPVVFSRGTGSTGPKVSIAEDGMLQLAVRNENAATFFRGPNFEQATVFEHDGWVTDGEVSPDGTRFVTASNDNTARIWPVEGIGPPVILRHDDSVEQALFDPQGRRVLTRDYSGTLRIWEPDGTGDPLLLRWRGAELVDPVFSPDGRLLVVATSDGDLLMWRLTWPGLLEDLRDVTTECLPAELRRRFLGERDDQAAEVFAACERANGR